MSPQISPMNIETCATSTKENAAPKIIGKQTRMPVETEYFLHEVTGVETLRQIAMKYNVSVTVLKRLNQLQTDDIWSRSTIKIPQSKATKVAPPDEEMIRNERHRTQIKSLSLLQEVDEAEARKMLEQYHHDFKKAAEALGIIRTLSATYGLDRKEILSYYYMADCDAHVAEMRLKQDLQWEKMAEGKAKKKLHAKLKNNSAEEIELKKTR